jgi:hypothetical protein
MIMDTTTITLPMPIRSRSSSRQPEKNAAMEGFKIVSAPHMTPYMVARPCFAHGECRSPRVQVACRVWRLPGEALAVDLGAATSMP